MGKGKLILICQSGGEFVTKDDGSLSYDGGEANAVAIYPETHFGDLKLKLAELLNLEYKSLSVKYFLPGNKQTLITICNDKDLKRMFDFHEGSVTADVFVIGTSGFDREAFAIETGRASGIKLAETVSPSKASKALVTTDPVSTPAGPSAANLTLNSLADPADGTAHSPITYDVSATPADTVKKRRRAASRKNSTDAPTAAVTKTVRKTKKMAPRRKRMRKDYLTESDDDMEEERDTSAGLDGTNGALDVASEFNNLSPEEMVAMWKDSITGVGQEFKSVIEFRDALQRFSIAHRFRYKFKKNETSRASGMCAAEGCSWSFYASWVPSERVFKIKKMNETHTCGESSKTAHPTKNWLVSIIKDKLRESPHHKPKEISKSILRDFGVTLNYSQVYRGIEGAREQLQGSYKEAYNQLPWFCDKLLEANPGSFIKLLIDNDKKFQRLFISFDASIHGFQNGCRPLLFLDSTSLRSKYHEILLTATALDGDDCIFPVAFAIVDTENDDSWNWFLEELRSAVSSSRSITFVSDKQKGLMESVLKIFENSHHGYSIYHLLDDFMKNLKGPFHGEGKGSLPVNFLAAACAARLDSFRMSAEQVKKVSSNAFDWMMQIAPEYWTNAAFKGESYQHITFDVAESYANWIEEVWELPLIQKLERLLCKMTEMINNCRMNSSGWFTKLIPSREQLVKDASRRAHYLKVLFSSDTLFEVQGDSTHVVDMNKRDCSCLVWNATGLPCHHAIAVFNSTGRNVYDYCSGYFTVDSYRLTYSKSINLVEAIFKPPAKEKASVEEAEQVLPPSTTRTPTTHQKRRRKILGIEHRTVTCTKCKGIGHNKLSCKETS